MSDHTKQCNDKSVLFMYNDLLHTGEWTRMLNGMDITCLAGPVGFKLLFTTLKVHIVKLIIISFFMLTHGWIRLVD